jgi:transposase-like protein
VNLERWRGHVRAALASGESLAAYARRKKLSRHTLYAARRQMAMRGELSSTGANSTEPSAAAFVPVSIAGGMTVTASLTNGVRVSCEVADGAALRGVLSALAELPCSA